MTNLVFTKPDGPLNDGAIREIVRNAASASTPGDVKAQLVEAAQAYLAEHTLHRPIYDALTMAIETAEMLGDERPVIDVAKEDLAPLFEHIGAEFDEAFKPYPDVHSDIEQIVAALATASVKASAVLPMNRGKWLAKLGIVKSHIDAIGNGDVPEAPDADVSTETPDAPDAPAAAETSGDEVTDPEMREMLGLDPLPVVGVPGTIMAEPLAEGVDVNNPLSASSADTAHAREQPSDGVVPGAAPGSFPPPPDPDDIRTAYRLLREGMDLDDQALAARLGVSRTTLHNWLTGKTKSVKCSFQQARVLISEVDVRVAALRRAAEILSSIRA